MNRSKCFLGLLSLSFLVSVFGENRVPAVLKEDEQIELVPMLKIGVRGEPGQLGRVTNSGFKAPDFATVYRVSDGLKEAQFGVELAEKFQMTEVVGQEESFLHGKEGDKIVYYKGEGLNRFVIVNQTSQFVLVHLSKLDYSGHDGEKKPLVKGVPGVRESVRLASEMLSLVGVDEKELFFSCESSLYPKYEVLYHRVGYYDPVLRREVHDHYAVSVGFSQKIGEVEAFWNGNGGKASLVLGATGALIQVEHCLRKVEPISEFKLLGSDEIIAALREGFWWAEMPLKSESFEVKSVRLRAWVAGANEPQKNFPLLYEIEGQADDQLGEEYRRTVYMPALEEQRFSYPATKFSHQSEDQETDEAIIVSEGEGGVSKNELIGKWANFGGLKPGSVGYIRLVAIAEDGSFTEASIDFSFDGVSDQEGDTQIPPGAALSGLATGNLVLDKGEVILTEEEKSLGIRSITYRAEGDRLTCIVEGMTSETIIYSRVR